MKSVIGKFLKKEAFLSITNLFEFEDISSIPKSKGVYIIISNKQEFIYPNGKSRVIYIGQSTNLRRRIRSHKKLALEVKNKTKKERIASWHWSRYQYMARFGAKVFLYYPNSGNQKIQNFESEVIELFYDEYHALPIGNGAFSYRT